MSIAWQSQKSGHQASLQVLFKEILVTWSKAEVKHKGAIHWCLSSECTLADL